MNKAALAQIITLLQERGAMSFCDLFEALGLDGEALNDMLTALIDCGIVGERPADFVLTDWARQRFTRAAQVVAENLAAEVGDG